MSRYIVKRLFISLITLFILTTVVFFMLRTLPGDPLATQTTLSPELREKLREFYGLDQPILKQYVMYLDNLIHGDLGYSMKHANRSVSSIIVTHFPVSADLGIRALIFGYPLGIILGVVAARKRGKTADYVCIFLGILAVSVPSFILARILQWIFAVELGILPVAQWKGFEYTILPVFCIAFSMMNGRTMRSYMLEVTGQDYIKTAKAKGVPEGKRVWRHMFRNALLPVVTGLGPLVATTLTGTFVIENIFSIPGLGKQYVDSIKGLDYTLAMGLTIFFAAFLILANFIVDLCYSLVDPRVRVK